MLLLLSPSRQRIHFASRTLRHWIIRGSAPTQLRHQAKQLQLNGSAALTRAARRHQHHLRLLLLQRLGGRSRPRPSSERARASPTIHLGLLHWVFVHLAMGDGVPQQQSWHALRLRSLRLLQALRLPRPHILRGLLQVQRLSLHHRAMPHRRLAGLLSSGRRLHHHSHNHSPNNQRRSTLLLPLRRATLRRPRARRPRVGMSRLNRSSTPQVGSRTICMSP